MVFRPWSTRAVGRGRRGDVNLLVVAFLRLSQEVKKGYVCGQVGGNGGQSGGVDEFSRFAGSYPHRLWSKRGNPFAPSSAAVPLGPRMYSAKKNGVRARHELRVFADTPKWPKNQGYTPFGHFPIFSTVHGMYMTTYDTGGRNSLRSILPARSISWCHI